MRRPLTLFALLTAVVLAGCGDKKDIRTEGESEATYVNTGGLTYQVQMSRQLNPSDGEDRDYLRGIPDTVEPPRAGQAWFGVFLRVTNENDDGTPALETASDFVIVDSSEKEREYRPIPIDNAFSYEPIALEPGLTVPDLENAAYNGPIQGSLVLFKVDYDSFRDRPLKLEIRPSKQGEEPAEVTLDV